MVQDVISVGIGVVCRYEELILVVHVAVAAVCDKVCIADLVMELSVRSHLVTVSVVVVCEIRVMVLCLLVVLNGHNHILALAVGQGRQSEELEGEEERGRYLFS